MVLYIRAMTRTPHATGATESPVSTRPVGRPPKGVPQGKETRRRIVEVATELFGAHGYHGTGMAEICRLAGVRSGALYYHIGSKEELLYDVLKDHVEESLRGEAAIVAEDIPTERKLERLITHHVAVIVHRRTEVAIFLHDQHRLTRDRAIELQRLRDEVEGLWRSVIAAGVADRTFRAVDGIEVNGLLGMINNVYYWYRPDGDMTPEAIGQRFVTLALRGLGAA